MGKVVKILISTAAFTSFAFFAQAQQAMLMGRVTDTGNKPVKEAGIFLKGDAGKGVAISDSMGLYATQPLPDGKYKVKVVVGKTVYTSEDVSISAATTRDKYYNFKLGTNRKASLVVDTHNPFMEQRIGAAGSNSDNTPNSATMHIDRDSNGNMIRGNVKPLPHRHK